MKTIKKSRRTKLRNDIPLEDLIDLIPPVIANIKSANPPGSSGLVDCPRCKKKDALSFSISEYNGHIHLACTCCDFFAME